MEKITFCINTAVNERNHVELLLRSLYKNLSRKDHNIIIYVENDNQDTVGYLKSVGKEMFSNLKIIVNPLPVPLGYARNINLMFEIAETDIVSYLQSDMVIGPNYDEEVIKFLTPDTIISATRIEPPLHPPSPEKITHDFGLDPKSFNLDEFSTFAEKCKKNETTDFWFAPFTLYKKIWLDIGGHDTLFRRSREDSDLLYRLSIKGVKTKQARNAIVYHFTCTSSRGPEWWTEKTKQRTQLQQFADQIEMLKFLRKWPSSKHTSIFNQETEFKYRISINFLGVNPKDINIIQPYFLFHRIYIDNEELRNQLYESYNKFQKPANLLLNITDEQWFNYKKYYRTWEFDDIFVSKPIGDDDVIININLAGQLFNDILIQPCGYYFEEMNNIVHANKSEGSGEFELGELPANLIINKAENRIFDNLIVKNPPIDDISFIYL